MKLSEYVGACSDWNQRSLTNSPEATRWRSTRVHSSVPVVGTKNLMRHIISHWYRLSYKYSCRYLVQVYYNRESADCNVSTLIFLWLLLLQDFVLFDFLPWFWILLFSSQKR